VFKSLEDTARDLGSDLILQKLVYVACQLGVLLFITHRWAVGLECKVQGVGVYSFISQNRVYACELWVLGFGFRV